jgi:radical SAM superfamily enzyme YgiQ (UPF0313 family)
VVNEIEHLRKKYDPEEIYFFDDLFIASKSRFQKICDAIKERGLHKDIVFRAYARVDLVNDELADTFAELNFKYIDFGFESNSPRILEYFNKKNATPELNQHAIDILAERGISIGGNFIIGSPIETEEDIETTHAFIKHNVTTLDRLSIGPLIANPGTAAWEYAKEKGLVTEDETMDWNRLCFDPEDFDLDYFLYLGEKVAKSVFAEWIETFTRIALEINLRGYIRRLERRLNFSHIKLEEARQKLSGIEGSRVMRLSNRVRLLTQRIRNKGVE